MARPLKTGIDYYPVDVDFLKNLKVRKIMMACGAGSVAVLICLLGSIYGDEGYYMWWDEDVRFLVADEVGAKESLVHEVVMKALSVGFFDQGLFDKFQILSSVGIQSRYFEATSRRQNRTLKTEYLLVDLANGNNNGVNVYNNSINDDRSTQSKEKKTKKNQIKAAGLPELWDTCAHVREDDASIPADPAAVFVVEDDHVAAMARRHMEEHRQRTGDSD